MAQRSKKHSLLASLSSLPTDNASAEAAWRQALLLRELSRDDRVTARKRRAEVEAPKENAENEAISATNRMCAELQAQARMKLQEAEDRIDVLERAKTREEVRAEEREGQLAQLREGEAGRTPVAAAHALLDHADPDPRAQAARAALVAQRPRVALQRRRRVGQPVGEIGRAHV